MLAVVVALLLYAEMGDGCVVELLLLLSHSHYCTSWDSPLVLLLLLQLLLLLLLLSQSLSWSCHQSCFSVIVWSIASFGAIVEMRSTAVDAVAVETDAVEHGHCCVVAA